MKPATPLLAPRASNFRPSWPFYNPKLTPSSLQQEPSYDVSGRATQQVGRGGLEFPGAPPAGLEGLRGQAPQL